MIARSKKNQKYYDDVGKFGDIYSQFVNLLLKLGILDAIYSLSYSILRLFNQNRKFEKFSIRYRQRVNELIYLGRLPFDIDLKVLPQKDITSEDIEICKRLITAYWKSVAGFASKQINGIWSDNIQKHYGALISIIEEGDPEKLALEMTVMFQQDFLNGITDPPPIHKAQKFRPMQELLKYLTFLAEYLAVVCVDYDPDREAQYALEDLSPYTHLTLPTN